MVTNNVVQLGINSQVNTSSQHHYATSSRFTYNNKTFKQWRPSTNKTSTCLTTAKTSCTHPYAVNHLQPISKVIAHYRPVITFLQAKPISIMSALELFATEDHRMCKWMREAFVICISNCLNSLSNGQNECPLSDCVMKCYVPLLCKTNPDSNPHWQNSSLPANLFTVTQNFSVTCRPLTFNSGSSQEFYETYTIQPCHDCVN